MSLRWVVAAAVAAAVPCGPALADGPGIQDDTWAVAPSGAIAVDAGVAVGFPAELPTGMSRGLGAGVSFGRRFALGARFAWGTASESSTAWIVTHDDFRFRITGAVAHAIGRGSLALRLGVGPTVVYERRDRQQGMRAGLTGSDLHQTALGTVPAIDLAAVVQIRIAGHFGLSIAGGPSAEIRDGGLHGGWTAELGVLWAP